MQRLLLCSFSLVALTANATGQIAPTQANVVRALPQGTAPTAIEYTLGEGYELVTTAQRSGPETIFNTRAPQIYYFAYVASTDEFIDEGSFHYDGVLHTEQINGLTFDYCSMLPDPVGDAVTVELRFYEEVVPWQGIVGWIDANNRNEKCGYVLSGLPGLTSTAWFDCWAVHLNLSGGFECTLPQEQSVGSGATFGWSGLFFDAQNSNQSGLASMTLFGGGYDGLWRHRFARVLRFSPATW